MFNAESFRQVVAQPSRAATAVDWGVIESRMGVSLPSDYKWLVENYGPGSFGGFFYVFCPHSSRKGVDLECQYGRTNWALEYLTERGCSLPRRPAELLSFGRSENGDVAYWVMGRRDEPDRWSVALGEPRGPLWEEYDGGMVEWLEAVLSRRVRMNIFPKDFPRRVVCFNPLT
ncbi:SMI1/KNR4 family protein [Micromonospora pallida]|uniref:SMI1/KNR4 family protein n=1 Tax=Micromonospora pallida TaxID=145854 RepID=UPI00159F2493